MASMTDKFVPHKKRRLVELLLECPSILNTEARHALLKELSPHIAKAIQTSDIATVHVLNIVNTCMNHDGGLEHLIETLRFFDKKTKQFKALKDFLKSRATIAKAKKIPLLLLPYLVDYKLQEAEFSKAIAAHRHSDNIKRCRPFLCWVHGHENDSCEMFLRRLKRELKNCLLRYDMNFRNDSPLKACPIICGKFHNVSQLHTLMRKSIENRFMHTPSQTDIATLIAQHPGPVIFSIHLEAEDWRDAGGMKMINGFIDFWSCLPALTAQKHLVLVCIFFHHEEKARGDWLSNWLRGKPVNPQIREALRQLDADLQTKKKVSGKVLPELKSIKPRDVNDWILEFNHILEQHHVNTLELRPKVRLLFEEHGNELAMDDLAPKLTTLLQET